jgi:zinc protease
MPGDLRLERLENGLTVCLLLNRQAPLVSTSLWYGAGARDEEPAQAGIAHFLEHMMFKGSRRYAAGEIDRRTRELGGSNNAFTSHDSTAYYFSFSNDRWLEALDIEADRMASLTLDAEEVERERRVIEEELAMYDDDPWHRLDREVHRVFFSEHPYGRQIIGTRDTLREIDAERLRAFHSTFYRPDNAVLVVAGDLDETTLDRVRERFGACEAGGFGRPAMPAPVAPAEAARVELRKGDVARLLLALPSPGADHPDYAPLRLLLTLLGGPRTSRLAARLVEEEQLCVAASTEITETVEPSMAVVAAELLPGVEPEAVEERVAEELARLTREPVDAEEIEQARRILVADWVFGMERIHQQALGAGMAVSLFDRDYAERHLRRALACSPEQLAEIAAQWIRPAESSVTGWSLPQ